jgi:hypothetical protein
MSLSDVYSRSVSGKASISLPLNSSSASFNTFERDPEMIKMEKTFLNCFKSVIDKEEEINPTKNIINNSNNTTNNIKTYNLEDAIRELALMSK